MNETLNQRSVEEWFEEQFNKRERMEVENGQYVEVLDIAPEHAKSDIPVLMGSSYGSGAPIGMKANLLEMAKQQRRAISIEAPHGVEHHITNEKTKEMGEYFLRQIAALLPVLDQKGIEKVDVIAFSEGCIYTTLAAYLYPERFRNIVLVNPGGMIGEDKPERLVLRFMAEAIAGAIDLALEKKDTTLSPGVEKQMKEGFSDFLQYLWGDKKAAAREIKDISQTQIPALFKEIKQHDIGIAIIHSVDDQVFPMQRVQKQAEGNPEESLWIDGFYSVKGSHGEFLMNPEVYTRAAESALSALEVKQKKKETT